MPKDIQEQFKDYENCPICKTEVPDSKIRTVVARKNNVRRVFSICDDCYQKCQTNETFDKNVNRYVFEHKIGKEYRR